MPEILTAEQIYALAVGAGFSPSIEVVPGVSLPVCMTAIALRESSGEPGTHNGNAETGDDSYGLWQINMKDPDVCRAVQANILMPVLKTQGAMAATYEALLDPRTNAKAAHLLYGGSLRNLGIAWYVYRADPTPEQAEDQVKYERHLPAAQAAEIAWKVANPS
jgi:hypothetical protein